MAKNKLIDISLLSRFKDRMEEYVDSKDITFKVEGTVVDGEPDVEAPSGSTIYFVRDGDVYSGWVYILVDEQNQWISLGKATDVIDWSDVSIADTQITFTEPVGTVTTDMITAGGGSYSLDVEGKSVKDVLTGLFASEKDPEYVAPTVSFTYASANTSYEVGTTITPTVTTKMTSEGSYTYGAYGSDSTGVTLANISISSNAGETFTTETATFASLTVEDDTNFILSCSATTSAATAYGKTNLGNKSDVLIPTKNFSSTRTVKGYRNYYYGWYGEYLTTLTAAQVKAKKKTTSLSIATQTLDIATQTFFVAFPVSVGKKAVALTNETANGPIGVNEPIVVSIGGVDDYSPIDYYVYIANGAIDSGTKVSIKIS